MEKTHTDPSPIALLLVDDHQLFIDGLRSILDNDTRFAVWNTARDGREALQLLQRSRPDVVVMDLNMPRIDGQQAAAKALAMYPDLKILVVSMYYTVSLRDVLKTMGVAGFIPKDSDATVLTQAIETIHRGGKYFVKDTGRVADAPAKDRQDFRQKYNLTRREVEIIRLIRENKTTQEIADLLFISPLTVETHRRNICYKLDIKGSNGLFIFAHQHFEI